MTSERVDRARAARRWCCCAGTRTRSSPRRPRRRAAPSGRPRRSASQAKPCTRASANTIAASASAEALTSTIEGVSGTCRGTWRGEVDAGGDDQRQRQHSHLRHRVVAGARSIPSKLGHDHERRHLHQPGGPGGVDEALHQALDDLGVRLGLLELRQHRDVGRLEQSERDHRHHPDHDEARHDPAVQLVARQRWCPGGVESCQPAASVTVTTVGMISTIFGISRVVNSTRGGNRRAGP